MRGSVFLLDTPFTKTLRNACTCECVLIKRLVPENACVSISLCNCFLKVGVNVGNMAIKMGSLILKKNSGILK